jgi:hypothetical protein
MQKTQDQNSSEITRLFPPVPLNNARYKRTCRNHPSSTMGKRPMDHLYKHISFENRHERDTV